MYRDVRVGVHGWSSRGHVTSVGHGDESFGLIDGRRPPDDGSGTPGPLVPRGHDRTVHGSSDVPEVSIDRVDGQLGQGQVGVTGPP